MPWLHLYTILYKYYVQLILCNVLLQWKLPLTDIPYICLHNDFVVIVIDPTWEFALADSMLLTAILCATPSSLSCSNTIPEEPDEGFCDTPSLLSCSNITPEEPDKGVVFSLF